MPVPVVIFLVVIAVGTVVLTSTRFGRQIYYTGTNPVAAWYSGINVARTKLLAFVVSGLLAAMAGPLLASLTKRITPDMGAGFELGAIAVAVHGWHRSVGGTGHLDRHGRRRLHLQPGIEHPRSVRTEHLHQPSGPRLLLIFVVLIIQRAFRQRGVSVAT